MIFYVGSLAVLLVIAIFNMTYDRRTGEEPSTTLKSIARLLFVQLVIVLAIFMTWSRLDGGLHTYWAFGASLNVAYIAITRGEVLGYLVPGTTKNQRVISRSSMNSFALTIVVPLLILLAAVVLGFIADNLVYS